MDDLIKIEKVTLGIETVNARDLHGKLEVKTKFADWITRRIDDNGFVYDSDYTTILNSENSPPSREYHVSVDMAKHLAMLERSEKGMEIRQWFIGRENKLRESEKNLIKIDPSKNQIEVLQLALDQAKKLKEQAPLVMIANNFLESSTLKTILQVSKELGVGEKTLFKILREEKIFYYTWQDGKQVNVPYELHKTAGRFEVKNKTKQIKHSDGSVSKINYSQIRVTAKGEAYVCALLKKRNARLGREEFFKKYSLKSK